MLLVELKKIEARKRERERKTQDLQKLISRADSGLIVNNSGLKEEGSNINSSSSNIARRHDRKLHKKKLAPHQRPVRAVENVVSNKLFLYTNTINILLTDKVVSDVNNYSRLLSGRESDFQRLGVQEYG